MIAIEPDNWDAQDDLVSTYSGAGRFDDAIEVLTKLIERRPECADQHLQLGDLYNKTDRRDQAINAYLRAVELNPDYLEATIKVGTARLRQGEYVEAAQAFNRAVEINDRIVSAYVGLGVAQQGLGQSDEAFATLEMAAEIEPNSTLLFSEIARLQLTVTAAEQVKKYVSPQSIVAHPQGPPSDEVSAVTEQQIQKLKDALVKRPHHADVHYRLGLLLRHQGDLDGAIESFQRAVEINPQYFKALTKLGLALRETGRLDEAVGVHKRALDIDAESVELHYQLGLIFADRNEFSLALERFEFAASKEPDNLDYVANLALALQNMGLLDRAQATWQTLCELTQDGAEVSTLPRPSTSDP